MADDIVAFVDDFVEDEGEVAMQGGIDPTQSLIAEGGEAPPADKVSTEDDAKFEAELIKK